VLIVGGFDENSAAAFDGSPFRPGRRALHIVHRDLLQRELNITKPT
jgi:hypothetical protein